jgi:hypothetical protein
MTKHSIFLYRDEFSKKLIHQITNHHIMHEQFYIDVYAINIEMVLEIIFTLAKGVYPEIRQHIQKIIIRNFELSREYSKWFNDMFASRAISEEFMNANIQGKMIDGKPYFFEVIAKTRDTNIRNRKEIL